MDQADVGVGTVFRHFPTKEALLEAVLVEQLRQMAGAARELADAADPGPAFFGFLELMVGHSATKNAFADALAVAGVGQELLAAVETLLVRAKTTGAVRDDVGPGDVIAVLVGASRAAQYAGSASAHAVSVIFDGLRSAPG